MPIQFTFAEQLENLGRLAHHGYSNLVGIEAILKKLLVAPPPVRHTRDGNGHPVIDVLLSHFIRAGSGFEGPLIVLKEILIKLLVVMLRHRADVYFFNHVRLGLMVGHRECAGVVDGDVVEF